MGTSGWTLFQRKFIFLGPIKLVKRDKVNLTFIEAQILELIVVPRDKIERIFKVAPPPPSRGGPRN